MKLTQRAIDEHNRQQRLRAARKMFEEKPPGSFCPLTAEDVKRHRRNLRGWIPQIN
jgi:hypothetical protein